MCFNMLNQTCANDTSMDLQQTSIYKYLLCPAIQIIRLSIVNFIMCEIEFCV